MLICWLIGDRKLPGATSEGKGASEIVSLAACSMELPADGKFPEIDDYLQDSSICSGVGKARVTFLDTPPKVLGNLQRLAHGEPFVTSWSRAGGGQLFSLWKHL